ncbi:MAG: amidohydrolase family protein [Polyangiales bacterium]
MSEGCLHVPAFPEIPGEVEGARVPEGLTVIDAHVHLFPDKMFDAIWRWFDTHAWNIRYRLHTEQVVEFLVTRGVERFCALHYAHKPGMARSLNTYVAEVARAHREIIPLGTVMPGEPDARAIVREALGPMGLRGIKLHCHVQGMAADDPRIDEVYQVCAEMGRPVIIHAGRQPALPGYPVDVLSICNVERVERVLQRHPKLSLIVPHLGVDEYEGYESLLDRHENLWLDTTGVIGSALGMQGPPASLFPGKASRLLYGTDFPNIPYFWDRELKGALAAGMTPEVQRAFFAGNALRLFE